MNQPQVAEKAEAHEITVRLEVTIKQSPSLANLTALVDKMKPLIEQAGKLGDVEAVALFGRQKWPIV